MPRSVTALRLCRCPRSRAHLSLGVPDKQQSTVVKGQSELGPTRLFVLCSLVFSLVTGLPRAGKEGCVVLC